MTLKLVRKLTRTEIQWGMLAYSAKRKKEFYDKLPDIFDVIYESEVIESRHAGKCKIWLNTNLMRKFKIGQILILEIKDKKLHIKIDPDQDPNTMKEFSISKQI